MLQFVFNPTEHSIDLLERFTLLNITLPVVILSALN